MGARFVPRQNGRQFVTNVVAFQATLISSPDRFARVGSDTAPETFAFGSNL